jgi:beta-lactam-binding protein with PASTA domain
MPTMPNVVGVEYPDALTAMVKAGVRVVPLGYFQADPVIVTWVKAPAKPGFVVAQFPSQGTVMAANSAVLLNVSAPPVSVANYGGVGS